MDSRLVSTSGHLGMHLMKLAPIQRHVSAQDLTIPTLELDLPSSVKITSVKLEADSTLVIITVSSTDDPLWDGQECWGTSTCCGFNNPPWFCKQLPQPTTDDIELRICGDDDISNKDTPIEIVEMYIR